MKSELVKAIVKSIQSNPGAWHQDSGKLYAHRLRMPTVDTSFGYLSLVRGRVFQWPHIELWNGFRFVTLRLNLREVCLFRKLYRELSDNRTHAAIRKLSP